jgi:COP9 signalosome complex subunit 1
MNVIKASFYMQNWSNVLSYVSKAEQAIESLESTTKSTPTPSAISSMINPMEISTTNALILSDAILTSRLKVYAGIAELATKRYKLAARHFLGVSFDHCSNYFQDLISPQTLIQYVCLCSLATFERTELYRLIIMSTNIKQYLELEPSIRDIIHKFYETSYSSCLALMSQFEPIFALDQYLSPHLRTLYYEIRHRTIITYFLPYKNASMTIMARQLNTTIDILEDELVYLIRTGKIKARIDSKNKILYVADTDQRWQEYQHALTITKQSEKLTRALLLRSAIIKANLSVKDDSISPSIRSSNNNNNNNNSNITRRQFVPNLQGHMIMDEGDLSDDAAMN